MASEGNHLGADQLRDESVNHHSISGAHEEDSGVQTECAELPPNQDAISEAQSPNGHDDGDDDAEKNGKEDDGDTYNFNQYHTHPRVAYLSVDGIAQGAPTCGSTEQTMSQGDTDLSFRVHLEHYDGAYARMVIEVRAVLGSDWVNYMTSYERGEKTIGHISIYGCQLSRVEYRPIADKKVILAKIKAFNPSNPDDKLPAEAFEMSIQLKKVHFSLQQRTIDGLLRRDAKGSGKITELMDKFITAIKSLQAKIKTTSPCTQTGQGKDDQVSLANPAQIQILFLVSEGIPTASHENFASKFKGFMERDDPAGNLWPLAPYFSQSKQIKLLRDTNQLDPDDPRWPTNMAQPARDEYADRHDLMVVHLMGNSINVHEHKRKAAELPGISFTGWAIKLPHFNNRQYLLIVDPGSSGELAPKEGETCLVNLPDVFRIVSAVADKRAILKTLAPPIQEFVTRAELLPLNSEEEMLKVIVDDVQTAFPKLPFDSNIAKALLRTGEEEDDADLHRDRISNLAETWIDSGFNPNSEGERAAQNEEWKGMRITTPIEGVNRDYLVFSLTVPLEPKSEVAEGAERQPVKVDFKALDIQPCKSDDTIEFKNLIEQYISDKDNAINMTISYQPSDKPHRIMVGAVNDLHHPASADQQAPPSRWAQGSMTYLLDFQDPSSASPPLQESYPWMANVLDSANHELVHPELLSKWKALDKDQQGVYKAMLGHNDQRMLFVNGVPGCGKTHLMRFAAEMALHGEKGKTHNVKILYVAPQNHNVDAFSQKILADDNQIGCETQSIRLNAMVAEKENLADLATEKEAQPPLYQEDEAIQFMTDAELAAIEVEFSRLASEVHAAKRAVKPRRDMSLSLHQAVLVYIKKNPSLLAELRETLEHAQKSDTTSSNEWLAFKQFLNQATVDFLGQYSGVISTTPVASSAMNFRIGYRPDIVLIDEASRMSEGETCVIIRNTDPKLLVHIGDVNQLGVHVEENQDNERENPFKLLLGQSVLHRAVAHGVNHANLNVNHRATCGLEDVASNIFYSGAMKSYLPVRSRYVSGSEKWRDFLKTILPNFKGESNRALVEFPESSTSKVNKSTVNETHVSFIVDLAILALKEKTLEKPDILVLCFYKMQVYEVKREIARRRDAREISQTDIGLIRARTVDMAQGDEASLVIVDTVQTYRAGFIKDRRRLNVSVTRAKSCEVLLLNHTVLTQSTKEHAHNDTNVNIQFLRDIYNYHQAHDQISVLDHCRDCCQAFTPLHPAEGHVCRFDVKREGQEKCGVCQSPYHATKECDKPHCTRCKKLDHKAAECKNCPICGEFQDHDQYQCPERTCRACRKKGHHKRDCPDNIKKCNKCQQEGHIAQECQNCRACGQDDHVRANCPNTSCNGCGETGHVKVNCPRNVCHNCGKTGHLRKDCPSKDAGKTCRLCGMMGHTTMDCPDNKKYELVVDSEVEIYAVEDASAANVPDGNDNADVKDGTTTGWDTHTEAGDGWGSHTGWGYGAETGTTAGSAEWGHGSEDDPAPTSVDW